MKTIICCTRKGGEAKTTTAFNLAYELSKHYSVLLVDFDSQGDGTKYTKQLDTEFNIADVLKDHKFDINTAIYPAIINGEPSASFSVLPGRDGDLVTRLEMDMISLAKREERLKRHLDNIKNKPDFVIVDTPPGTGILSLNAVYAADFFIFPTSFKEHSLDGVETMINHIEDNLFVDEEALNFLVVPTRISKIAKKQYAFGTEYLKGRWPNNTAATYIWERSIFAEAEQEHEPLSVYKKGHEAAMYYSNLAKEVLSRV